MTLRKNIVAEETIVRELLDGLKVLHLTHTDFRVDQRILRAIAAGKELGADVRAIGITAPSAGSSSDLIDPNVEGELICRPPP